MSVETPCTLPAQFLAPYIICTFVLTCGLTPWMMWESCFLTASASSAVIVCPCPMPPETGPWLRRSGKTIIRLLPIDDICLTIIVEAPLPIASTEMTAAMPTMMPMQVRSERVLLRIMARIATLNTMPKFIVRIIANFAARDSLFDFL